MVGPEEGATVGDAVGPWVGALDGLLVGLLVGAPLGIPLSVSGHRVCSTQKAASIGLQGTENTNTAYKSLCSGRVDAPQEDGIRSAILASPLKRESRKKTDTWATPSVLHLATYSPASSPTSVTVEHWCSLWMFS